MDRESSKRPSRLRSSEGMIATPVPKSSSHESEEPDCIVEAIVASAVRNDFDISQVSPMSTASVASFDRYQLNVVFRRLTRDGQPIRVTSRGLDLLITLVERAGQVVSHRDLLESAWAGLTVEETNLRVQIFYLRRALADDVATNYIQSVPGRGYCFNAPVSWTNDSSSDMIAVSAKNSISNRRRTLRPHDVRMKTETHTGERKLTVISLTSGSAPTLTAVRLEQSFDEGYVNSDLGEDSSVAARLRKWILNSTNDFNVANDPSFLQSSDRGHVLILVCDSDIADVIMQRICKSGHASLCRRTFDISQDSTLNCVSVREVGY
jgi:DNA-binding winged helix-turn-helix (wHTH) protein